MLRALVKNIFNFAPSNGEVKEALAYKEALALQQAGRLAEARVLYESLLITEPKHLGSLHGLAFIASEHKEYQLAVDLLSQLADLTPRHSGVHLEMGSNLLKLRQLDAAVACFDTAIAIDPRFVRAYRGRALALRGMNRLEASLADYERAIELKPDDADSYADRGNLLTQLSQMDAAIASFERAIALVPGHALAHFNKSLTLLLNGSFANGWELYESRWEADPSLKRPEFPQPMWLGKESLEGSTVLLHGEQGLGDMIQFCRYATLVAARGARVIVGVPPSLAGILKGLEGAEIVQSGDQLPAFDYHCPFLSLPLAFRTCIDTIPKAAQYLSSDAGKLAYWSAKLGPRSRLRVGLVWSGNPAHGNDHNRSIPLSALTPHLPDCFDYISLQNEVRDSDRNALDSSRIRDYGAQLKDFSDTAALCDLMDLVICVDTSVTHLSGALGRPTWLLLPYVPDWRWLLDRADSPWYPSIELYRQTAKREWKEVIEKVRRDLLLLAGGPHATPVVSDPTQCSLR